MNKTWIFSISSTCISFGLLSAKSVLLVKKKRPNMLHLYFGTDYYREKTEINPTKNRPNMLYIAIKQIFFTISFHVKVFVGRTFRVVPEYGFVDEGSSLLFNKMKLKRFLK